MWESATLYLDDLFEGQGKSKHHRSLRGNHLLVNGVVEMGHLQQSHDTIWALKKKQWHRNEYINEEKACHLFEDYGLSVEFVCSISSLLDLGRDGKPQGGELPDLPEQTDQPVWILDLQPAVHMVQVHHTVTGLETIQRETNVIESSQTSTLNCTLAVCLMRWCLTLKNKKTAVSSRYCDINWPECFQWQLRCNSVLLLTFLIRLISQRVQNF